MSSVCFPPRQHLSAYRFGFDYMHICGGLCGHKLWCPELLDAKTFRGKVLANIGKGSTEESLNRGTWIWCVLAHLGRSPRPEILH